MSETVNITPSTTIDEVNITIDEDCNINVNVLENVETVNVVVSSVGQKGDTGDVGGSSWIDIAGSIHYNDLTQSIATGRVLVGVLDGVTIYRYITTSKNGLYPSEDSFYGGFDGTTLTNLIITRG